MERNGTSENHLLRFVVGLLAEAVEHLLVVLGGLAGLAHELSHVLGHGLGDADARPVEPVVANVAAHIEP